MDRLLQKKIDIEKPRYDQSTYIGRAKHFFITTNPLNILKTSSELEEARSIVQNYRSGIVASNLTEDRLWHAKHVYDSAFHPDTGEKMFVVGRMSFQVPGNMFITGCLLQFYKSTPAVIFWQWFNQTFNAVVNYTNRSGDAPISVTRLATSYVLATTGAVVTALGINHQVQRFPSIVGRFVPFVAVAAANCINIPCMRSAELSTGTTILDENGEKLGQSTVVGRRAIGQVLISRILMAAPGMVFPPFVMEALERRGTFIRYPWLGAPLQIGMVGIFLTFMTPLCCAVFPQMSSIAFHKLEAELQERIKEERKGNTPSFVYYNKGQRIKCYSCSSVEDSHCNDPFDKQHQQNKPFPLVDCNDYCFKWAFQDTDGQKQLIRNCSTSLNIKMEKYLVCITESRSSVGYLCFCNKDKCNQSSTKSIINKFYHCLFVLFFLNYFLL